MNIYLLVEGQSTEAEVYPAWLSYLLPELKRVYNYKNVVKNNYYLFSSNGMPYINNDILNAIKDINCLGKYDYFVICVDSDAATVEQRKHKIHKLLNDEGINLKNTKLKIVVQNCCIETWFLGNRKVYKKNPNKNMVFKNYSDIYNVSTKDPEQMGKPNNFEGSISQFHFKYLKVMFNERCNMVYSKSNSSEVQKNTYLEELQNRVRDEPLHLKSFNDFLDFCSIIRAEIDR